MTKEKWNELKDAANHARHNGGFIHVAFDDLLELLEAHREPEAAEPPPAIPPPPVIAAAKESAPEPVEEKKPAVN